MRQLRRGMFAIALITLMLHAGVVTLGCLRVCWGTEHRHASGAAEDCPMHHHAPVQSTQHDHHGHGNAAAPPDNEGPQLVCGCSSDPTSPYVGPAGILAPTVSLSYSASLLVASSHRYDSPDHFRFPPLAPPPRSPFAALS
jgi:hypothetical protein